MKGPNSEESRGSALAENTVAPCDSEAMMRVMGNSERQRCQRSNDSGKRRDGDEKWSTTRKGNDDRKREVDVKSSHCGSYRSCSPWLKEYTCKVRWQSAGWKMTKMLRCRS